MNTATSPTFRENLALYAREVAARQVVLKSMPTYLGLVLTTRCNLRCPMCIRVRVKGEVPAVVREKVRPLYPYLKHLQWQGGEVFVVDYFKDMFLEACAYRQINHSIITSGSLIDREWADLLTRGKVHLSLSIDSVVARTYERIRLGTSLDKILAALAYLSEAEETRGHKIGKNLNVVVMAENKDEIGLFLPFAMKYGFAALTLTPRFPLDDEQSLYNSRAFPQREKDLSRLKSALSELSSQAKKTGIGVDDRVTPVIENLFKEDPRTPQAMMTQELSADWDCFMPWRGLFVNAEYGGKIFPDCMCYHTPLGNISDTSLTEAWNNEAMQEYRKRVLAKSIAGWCTSPCSKKQLAPSDYWRPEGSFEGTPWTGSGGPEAATR